MRNPERDFIGDLTMAASFRPGRLMAARVSRPGPVSAGVHASWVESDLGDFRRTTPCGSHRLARGPAGASGVASNETGRGPPAVRQVRCFCRLWASPSRSAGSNFASRQGIDASWARPVEAALSRRICQSRQFVDLAGWSHQLYGLPMEKCAAKPGSCEV